MPPLKQGVLRLAAAVRVSRPALGDEQPAAASGMFELLKNIFNMLNMSKFDDLFGELIWGLTRLL